MTQKKTIPRVFFAVLMTTFALYTTVGIAGEITLQQIWSCPRSDLTLRCVCALLMPAGLYYGTTIEQTCTLNWNHYKGCALHTRFSFTAFTSIQTQPCPAVVIVQRRATVSRGGRRSSAT